MLKLLGRVSKNFLINSFAMSSFFLVAPPDPPPPEIVKIF